MSCAATWLYVVAVLAALWVAAALVLALGWHLLRGEQRSRQRRDRPSGS